MIVVWIVIFFMLLIVAGGLGAAWWFKRRRRASIPVEAPYWQSIGIPPPLLNEALSIIRFEATRALGDWVLDIPWGGFIEWTIVSPSKMEPRFDRGLGAGKLPIFTIRWHDKIEETSLIPSMLLWMRRYAPPGVTITGIPGRIGPDGGNLAILAARLRSDLEVQFNRRAYVQPEVLPPDAPPAAPSVTP